ncbi:MAG: hypothetical protein WD802_07590 [Gemmatimonadaceae bacterium]
MRSDIVRGALLGLVILGVGGRLLMRVVAIMQGATAGWTVGGTMTVVFLGTVSGFVAGLIYHLLRRFVEKSWLRTTAFIVICGLISWRGVKGLPPYQQAMFMGLVLVYLVIVDVLGRLASRVSPQQDMSFTLTG